MEFVCWVAMVLIMLVCLSTLMFVTSLRLITKSSEKKVSRVFYLLPGTVAGGVGSVSGGAVPRFSRNSRRRRESCDGAVLFSDVFMTHNGTFLFIFPDKQMESCTGKTFYSKFFEKEKREKKKKLAKGKSFYVLLF